MSEGTTQVVSAPVTSTPRKKATKKSPKKKSPKGKGKTTKKAKAPKDPEKALLRKRAKAVGVTANQFRILIALKDSKERSATQLAEATGIVKGKKLPDLAEKGLIKTADYEDQRAFQHSITSKGKKALQTGMAVKS